MFRCCHGRSSWKSSRWVLFRTGDGVEIESICWLHRRVGGRQKGRGRARRQQVWCGGGARPRPCGSRSSRALFDFGGQGRGRGVARHASRFDSDAAEAFVDAGTDSKGRVWASWQSFRAGEADVYARFLDPKSGKWSEMGPEWSPGAVKEAPSFQPYLDFDCARHHCHVW